MSAALQALADKVEAGDEAEVHSLLRIISSAARDQGKAWPSHDAMKAYRGSLDAAKSLHYAVLPGWIYLIGPQISGVSMSDHEDPRWWNAMHNGHPSRGWLLAIIRALIAGGRE